MKNGKWKEDTLKKDGLQMRSVWSIGTSKPSEKLFGKHPTQKPLDLLRRIVLASTNEGDTVLDPFAGSSTTGIATVINGRKFIGIDTEEKYLDLSVNRYKGLAPEDNEDKMLDCLHPKSFGQQYFLEKSGKYKANKRKK
jgi:site-specific DNA-methyltransferase (adenine-specific)